ncbi:MAG: hypothetical protein OER56_08315 [Hyphomicrobiales bacterium]|nr:hypothetical protein [Hyphomicrobiales bacterium]
MHKINKVFKDEVYRKKARANVKGSEQRLDFIRGLYQSGATLLCADANLNARVLLNDDVNTLSNDLREARREAIYLVAIANNVYAAEVARALNLSRAAVSRMIAQVEEAREDPSIDARLTDMERVVGGIKW